MASKIIITALVIYLILLLSISIFQRKLLYYPKVNNHSDGYKLNHEIKVVNINSENKFRVNPYALRLSTGIRFRF